MSEGKGPVEMVSDESKALAVEVYKDGARPAVKAVGEALGSIARLAVGAFKALADAGNVIIERFQEKLTAKLKGVVRNSLDGDRRNRSIAITENGRWRSPKTVHRDHWSGQLVVTI